MNYVNLIGKARSAARFIELDNGKKVVKFTMSTKETYFDEKGKSKSRDTWHTLTAWGNWIKVLEELEDILYKSGCLEEYGSFAGDFNVNGTVKLDVFTYKWQMDGNQSVEQYETISDEGKL